LIEKIAIKKNGYLETFVVNETAQDVWFDNFRILSTGSLLVQETHYDPWGLELTGLGYQYAGVKVNKYLYNGKELIEDNGLQYYDYGARMYDASIGRWGVVDPMADLAPGLTPYRYGFNNPLKYTDPTGMFEYSDGYSTQDSRNSTGSMSFSGTYEYRTINTDLITFQHGENAPVSGGYIESYVKETGSVTGRSYFGSSPNLFGAGEFGGNPNDGNYLKGASLALYLTSTSLAFNEAKDTYNSVNAYRNSSRTKLQKTYSGYFKGSSKAVQNSQKALSVTKAVGRSLSRPFFFASVIVSGINVAIDPSLNNIVLNAADLGVGAAALIFATSPVGWIVGAGAAIYFTGRMANDIYDAYNNEN
jgi:RHS repeat-associated protein